MVLEEKDTGTWSIKILMFSETNECEYIKQENKEENPTWRSVNFRDIEIREKIGGGGVGIVYKANYNGFPVAIKTLFDPRVNDELKQEYMDELMIMRKLNHPNIVKFIGACMDPPNLCFIMELCDSSLYDILHVTRTQLNIEDKLSIAGNIASGMEYLHSLKPSVIHRDLKTQNIVLDSSKNAKICDFGLVSSKVVTAGTPCYMPPELFIGNSYSKFVDVYMFGIVLWEIFDGSIPFIGYDTEDIRRLVLSGERPRIPTVDTPLECQVREFGL